MSVAVENPNANASVAGASPPRAGGGAWNLVDILLEPTAAFRRIDEHPRVLLPLSALVLVKVAGLFIFFSPTAQPVKLLLNVLVVAVPQLAAIAVVAGVLLAGVVLFGGSSSYGKVFALVCHTFFAYFLVRLGASMVESFALGQPSGFDPWSPAYTNLGFLVSAENSLPLNYLLASIDVVVAYHLALLAVGLGLVSHEIPRVRAAWIVVASWALYLAVTVGIKVIVS